MPSQKAILRRVGQKNIEPCTTQVLSKKRAELSKPLVVKLIEQALEAILLTESLNLLSILPTGRSKGMKKKNELFKENKL